MGYNAADGEARRSAPTPSRGGLGAAGFVRRRGQCTRRRRRRPHLVFAPVSTPAEAILRVAVLVLAVTAGILVVVGGLLVYSIVLRCSPGRPATGSSWRGR
jgi:hypothetical protein